MPFSSVLRSAYHRFALNRPEAAAMKAGGENARCGVLGSTVRTVTNRSASVAKNGQCRVCRLFMLIQFYDGHHWAMADETLDRYANSAGPELRELMRFWTLMY